MTNIASKYQKSTAQVSKNVDHIKDNINIFEFTLSQDDMNQIAKLNSGERRYTRTEETLANFASWKVTYENK